MIPRIVENSELRRFTVRGPAAGFEAPKMHVMRCKTENEALQRMIAAHPTLIVPATKVRYTHGDD